MLKENPIDLQHIVGLVFDTTSANSGSISGIVVRLEAELGRKLLELACRHHISELVCGAACQEVYGDTESPNESCFEALAKVWHELDIGSFTLAPIKGRFLQMLKTEVLEFLQQFLVNEAKSLLRNDYKELLLLSIVFLSIVFLAQLISNFDPSSTTACSGRGFAVSRL